MEKELTIVEADFSNPKHRDAFKVLMNMYSSGITGGGKPISEEVLDQAIDAIPKRPDALILLGFMDGVPAAIANCFENFSTFKGMPLLNIHDFAVVEDFRGKGLAKALLFKIEEIANKRGYCKITLEVLEGNLRAKKIYADFGFQGYELDEKMGKALFWEKPLINQ